MRYPHAAVGPLRRGFVFRAFAEPAFDAARLSLNVFNSAAEIDAFVER